MEKSSRDTLCLQIFCRLLAVIHHSRRPPTPHCGAEGERERIAGIRILSENQLYNVLPQRLLHLRSRLQRHNVT